ncbi:ferredoxin/adrenodoxin reductase [Hysterangium stoloniferum]|nr:ferredoxin/adrenodoxin reductase [Hysterangium stoloniferum]
MPPLKVAIIGGGPSGFYVASRLLHLLPKSDFRVHIYDRLWAPHGLVRYGVAPDHPEVKNCTNKFDEVASDPRVQFFGNVNVGHDPRLDYHSLPLSLHALFPYYTHLVFATGAPRPKILPLSRFPRSSFYISALDLVHWYTMHPDSKYSECSPIPHDTRHISLIGHGNVSLDIARLLFTSPSRLSHLDIPSRVTKKLGETWETLKHISIIGRRGPKEMRFTAKELREMLKLEDASLDPIPATTLDDALRGNGDAEGGGLSRQQQRLIRLLKEGSQTATPKQKTFSIDFWRNPVAFNLRHPTEHPRVELDLEETKLDTSGGAVGTGTIGKHNTDLVVGSLGYESDPSIFESSSSLIGPFPWYDSVVGKMRTAPAGGRVLTPDGHIVRNVYASGWAGRGARGVLAGTILDANDVAFAVVEDWAEQHGGKENWGNGEDEVGSHTPKIPLGQTPLAAISPAGDLDGVPHAVEAGLLRGSVVPYKAWLTIEGEERRRGRGEKERERMAWEDVQSVLKKLKTP